MEKLGFLYEKPTVITISNGNVICCKGMKLKVSKDCFDERYLHERVNYYREELKEKKLKKDDIVEVLGCWFNFYGSYVKCSFNGETFDIDPGNLFYDNIIKNDRK